MEKQERNITICYRCKHGAAPGKFRYCRCPGLLEMERYTLPPVAVAKGSCVRYIEFRPKGAPQYERRG